MDNWNRDQTIVMIDAYRDHPCLYDPKDPNFCNKTRRTASYNEILETVKEVKENLTFAGVKRKIKTLQCQISKERTKMAKSQKKGDTERYVPALWCYKELSFLLRHLSETTESTSSCILGENENSELLGSENAEESIEQKSPSRKKLKLSEELQYQAKELIKQANLITSNNTKYKGKAKDFCIYLCSELDKIQSVDRLADVKMQILQMVHTAITDDRKLLESTPNPASFENQLPSSSSSVLLIPQPKIAEPSTSWTSSISPPPIHPKDPTKSQLVRGEPVYLAPREKSLRSFSPSSSSLSSSDESPSAPITFIKVESSVSIDDQDSEHEEKMFAHELNKQATLIPKQQDTDAFSLSSSSLFHPSIQQQQQEKEC